MTQLMTYNFALQSSRALLIEIMNSKKSQSKGIEKVNFKRDSANIFHFIQLSEKI